jgi:hypothetical protein
MNKLLHIFVLLFILNSSTAFAQHTVAQKPEKNVPRAVEIAFKDKFPAGDPVWFSNYQGRWVEQTHLVYEGRFMFDKRYSTVVYNNEGTLVAFAAQIESKEIPQKALQYMKDNFPNFPIMESILVTSGNTVTIELGIMIDDDFIVKVFSEGGDFIKSTKA